MIPTELESKALLGKEATDLYGRHLGRVIGIDRTPFGGENQAGRTHPSDRDCDPGVEA